MVFTTICVTGTKSIGISLGFQRGWGAQFQIRLATGWEEHGYMFTTVDSGPVGKGPSLYGASNKETLKRSRKVALADSGLQVAQVVSGPALVMFQSAQARPDPPCRL
ncbi:hypothetical protein JDV02_008255 [Purpureocillium takamizusanense]|uniref:Uncharacterized protein n=1 Tax=Purpureocillium takamizusanense TaxID=2060973 RepID=A0A9Q8QJT6_9HYPO|nr:uncharacterized protein JDV02_008255 [Purpureocillium takamizusanense]UNI22359.1 hypothetical protein JDV02_008255 [Purpureocillium takamizusanense]